MKTLSPILLATALSIVLFGCASNLEKGNRVFASKPFDRAASYWSPQALSGNPYAQYNLGLLWEHGYGSSRQDMGPASHWYLKSARQSHPPAMVRLANLQLKSGQRTPAVSWLVLAARWGNAEAIRELLHLRENVPPPDLLRQEIAREEREEREKQEIASHLMAILTAAAIVDTTASGRNTTYVRQPIHQHRVLTN